MPRAEIYKANFTMDSTEVLLLQDDDTQPMNIDWIRTYALRLRRRHTTAKKGSRLARKSQERLDKAEHT